MAFRTEFQDDFWTNLNAKFDIEFDSSHLISVEAENPATEVEQDPNALFSDLSKSQNSTASQVGGLSNQSSLRSKKKPVVIEKTINTRASNKNMTGKGISYKEDATDDDDEDFEIEIQRKKIKKNKKRGGKNSHAGRNPWTSQEDELLRQLVQEHGQKWSVISGLMGGARTGKQIRDRYVNKLDACIIEKPWTAEEDESLIKYWQDLGNRWSEIARYIEGRTESMVKNRFYSYIKKRRMDAKGQIIKEENSMSIERSETSLEDNLKQENIEEKVERKDAICTRTRAASKDISKATTAEEQPKSSPAANQDGLFAKLETIAGFSGYQSYTYTAEVLKPMNQVNTYNTVNPLQQSKLTHEIHLMNGGSNGFDNQYKAPSTFLYTSITQQTQSMKTLEESLQRYQQQLVELRERTGSNLRLQSNTRVNLDEDIFDLADADSLEKQVFMLDSRAGSNESHSSNPYWRLKKSQNNLKKSVINGFQEAALYDPLGFLSYP